MESRLHRVFRFLDFVVFIRCGNQPRLFDRVGVWIWNSNCLLLSLYKLSSLLDSMSNSIQFSNSTIDLWLSLLARTYKLSISSSTFPHFEHTSKLNFFAGSTENNISFIICITEDSQLICHRFSSEAFILS